MTAGNFKPVLMERRPVGSRDVVIQMLYCGVCHSDLHHAAGHNAALLGPTPYPCVPGHELAGVVTAVGDQCTKISVGMKVGVGCIVDSCLECKSCLAGEEQNCSKRVGTYGSKVSKSSRAYSPIGWTLGGYTSTMVVHEHFAIIIPDSYPMEAAGPVMCSAITMYEPLIVHGAGGGGKTVGIVGLGGLGVMGIKLAKALGCTVTAISRNTNKAEFAKQAGAANFIATADPAQLQAANGTFDIILNTVPVYHNYDIYTRLLKRDGKQVLLGLHKGFVAAMLIKGLTRGKSRLTVSLIGGIRNTQAVIDLCAEHNIVPEVQVKNCEELNQIFTDLDGANDAGVRYVLDIAGSLNENTSAKCSTARPPTLAVPKGAMTLSGSIIEMLRLICLWKT